jgi:hypothetical protein
MTGCKITTEAEALAAVRQDGYALDFVQEELRTAEVCLEAVKNTRSTLQFLPKELRKEIEDKVTQSTRFGD